jgi:hypothetical protein
VLPADSIVRKKAMHIVAMRIAGCDTPEIAKALEIKEKSVRQYLYIAGRNGWLAKAEWADPHDQLEYDTIHKVVRNLDEMLDSSDPAMRADVTLQTAKGTIFKRYDQDVVHHQPQMNMLSIRVELPPADNTQTMRKGSGGGTPLYVEAEVVDS